MFSVFRVANIKFQPVVTKPLQKLENIMQEQIRPGYRNNKGSNGVGGQTTQDFGTTKYGVRKKEYPILPQII